jgi:hypothetical protein
MAGRGSATPISAEADVSAETLFARFHKPLPQKRCEGTTGAVTIWDHALLAA